ncbi:transketolase family protein, partial [Clostridium perfringens]|nr:transketolase family protein [Clostridium perfringens]
FNMGIAEGNMIGVAAGLASSGKVPYVSSFAMFLAGRAYEQIRNSIGYPHLNVKLCATHAGISVGEDGASHQSIEDLSLMRGIPGMYVFQPCDEIETKAVIKSIANINAPCYVRLGRCTVESVNDENYKFKIGKGVVLHKGKKVAIVATGLMVQEALKAAKELTDIDPT